MKLNTGRKEKWSSVLTPGSKAQGVELLMYIPQHKVEAYISQGWECILLQGHHGYLHRFLAVNNWVLK